MRVPEPLWGLPPQQELLWGYDKFLRTRKDMQNDANVVLRGCLVLNPILKKKMRKHLPRKNENSLAPLPIT